ncbi:hypothetical protein ACX80I_15630 [Arthrobacter sp. MDT3-44]
MPYQPVVPEGQHLGTSHEVDGAVTGHLFDDVTNKLTGHAAWQWVDEPEDDYMPSYRPEPPPRELTPEERELIAQIIALVLIHTSRAAAAATPYVKRWWNEKALPPTKAAWKRVTAPRKADKPAPITSSSSSSRRVFVVSSNGVETAVPKTKISMKSTEWKQRFRAMLAAGAFRDEQLRILSNAWVDDDNGPLDEGATTDELTPQQFADRVQLMLETHPSLLEEETSAELIRVLSSPPERLDALDKAESKHRRT